jgi:hypothetical protein
VNPRKNIEPPTLATPDSVILNAKHHGFTLEVPRDRDVIVVRHVSGETRNPPSELAQGIREHKHQLMRDLLLKQAMDYLSKHYVKGADTSVLDEPGLRVSELHSTVNSMEDYRAAIRDYVQAGVNEFRRARNDRH